MPKISVIVPIYNVEKYLRDCLDSVVNQTFKDIEIICVDDCGTDNSIKIAEEIAKKDNRIKIIHHKTNNGIAISRNTGMDNATGKYIFFLDSDDYILPDALEKLYQKAIDTKADIITGRAQAFADGDSIEIQNRTNETNKVLEQGANLCGQVCLDNFIYMSQSTFCSIWWKLLKRDFIQKNNIRFINKKVHYHEDHGFWYKVCSCFPNIMYSDNLIAMYRIREGSAMQLAAEGVTTDFSKQFMLNIKDVFQYLDKYRKEDSNKLKNLIKGDELYRIYSEKNYWFYKYRWKSDNKLIMILGIPLYREKTNKDNKKVKRILGIAI